MKPVKGKITNGAFVPIAKRYYQSALDLFEGKDVVVTVKKPESQRSTDANSYYWKMLSLISEETGNSSNDLHETFKAKFLAHENLLYDEVVRVYVSTTKLSVKKFYIYCEEIRVFMQEQGYILPSENEIDNY